MAIAQSTLNQWTTGQFHKHSPPTDQGFQTSPANFLKDGITPSPSESISFEPSTPDSNANVPFYTSPASSFPPSVVQTPNTYEHSNQPFFSFHSPGSFSSKSPSMLDQSPSILTNSLPYSGQSQNGGKRGSSYGRHSIHALRRVSHSAVFPSRAGGGDAKGRIYLDGLNKRYCKVSVSKSSRSNEPADS